jgi:hypothetical protein
MQGLRHEDWYYSFLKPNLSGIIPKGTPVDLGQPRDRSRIAA